MINTGSLRREAHIDPRERTRCAAVALKYELIHVLFQIQSGSLASHATGH